MERSKPNSDPEGDADGFQVIDDKDDSELNTFVYMSYAPQQASLAAVKKESPKGTVSSGSQPLQTD